jgi:hypothetical protein
VIKKPRKNEEAKARYRAVKMQPYWVVTPGKQTNKRRRAIEIGLIDSFFCTVLNKYGWFFSKQKGMVSVQISYRNVLFVARKS